MAFRGVPRVLRVHGVPRVLRVLGVLGVPGFVPCVRGVRLTRGV